MHARKIKLAFANAIISSMPEMETATLRTRLNPSITFTPRFDVPMILLDPAVQVLRGS
jgi:hypothetical protein